MISLSIFALKPGGLLLLGSAESPGSLEGRFTAIAKVERIYRKALTGPVTGSAMFRTGPDMPRPGLRQPPRVAASAKIGLAAEICRQSLIDAFAPASILINETRECLYAVGPIGIFWIFRAATRRMTCWILFRPVCACASYRPRAKGSQGAPSDRWWSGPEWSWLHGRNSTPRSRATGTHPAILPARSQGRGVTRGSG